MSTDLKNGSSVQLPRLDLTGRMLKRRQQTANAKDPYDASRSFVEPAQPLEVFRRRREDLDSRLPPEREKRVKFEIVEEIEEGKADPGGGYNPYGHTDQP